MWITNNKISLCRVNLTEAGYNKDMQDTNRLPELTSSDDAWDNGGAVWERCGCDNAGCRHNRETQRRMAREDKGPRFNPVRGAEGVTWYVASAVGNVAPVFAECRECLNVPSQMDIC